MCAALPESGWAEPGSYFVLSSTPAALLTPAQGKAREVTLLFKRDLEGKLLGTSWGCRFTRSITDPR